MRYGTRIRLGHAMVVTLLLASAALAADEPPRLQTGDATLSLDFTDETVRAIYEAIGTAGGFDVVFDERFDPQVRTSVRLSDISVENALRFVSQATDHFFVVREPRTILVAPDTRQKRQQHMPVGRRTFALEHADPKNVIVVLRSLLQARQVFPDERLSTVTMEDTYDRLDLAGELIERLDVERPDPSLDGAIIWAGTESDSALRTKGQALPRLEVDTAETISLELADATARRVYETLGKSSGIEFLLHRTVDPAGVVSVDLEDVTVEEALRAVNDRLGQFSVVLGPRTVLVVPDTRERRMFEEHVGIQLFSLAHAETRTVITALRSQLQVRQLAEIRPLRAVALLDTIPRLQAAQEIVEEMDRP